MAAPKHQHSYRLDGVYQYFSPVGACTKAIYVCQCGHQRYGAALKGHWEIADLDRTVTDDGRATVFGRHKHTFHDTGYDPYYALGGPHTRVLQRCACGTRRVVTAKGHYNPARLRPSA